MEFAMRSTYRLPLLLGLAALIAASLSVDLRAAKIDAVRGKEYRLTKAHGPWMVLVATFREPPKEARTEGMSPDEAADELVYELRAKGIPAYTLSQGEVVDEIPTIDRRGQNRVRHIKSQQKCISVLAGNYDGTDEPADDARTAQKTLAYVKKFHPQFLHGEEQKKGFLRKLKNGGVYRVTPGRPGPLSGAFLTVNPLLTPEEARLKRRNPLLLKLNAGNEFSLNENKGKFTLVVASFEGKSVMQVANTKWENADQKFTVSPDNLDEAGFRAWELCKALRQHERKYDAWVWHDKYSSIVTVGSFDSPNDPRAAELIKLFGAKMKPHPQTGQDVLVAESLTIPFKLPPGKMPDKSWMFDPQPKLIEVPRL
jgi:hypothetical protein